MKTMKDVERRMTKLIAWSKSKKAGSHKGKTQRKETEESVRCQKCWDKAMDEFRKEFMKARDDIRKIIGE